MGRNLSLGCFRTPAQLAIGVGAMIVRLGSHGAGEWAARHGVQRRVGTVFLFDLGHVVNPSLRQLVSLRGREAVLQGNLDDGLQGRWQCCLPKTWLLHE
jgi:hypothetical protein